MKIGLVVSSKRIKNPKFKSCSVCFQEKNTELDFYKNSTKICKECHKKQTKEWQSKNVERAKHNKRKSYLNKTFGITPEQYISLFEKQNGCCAICDRHQNEFKSRLAIDHNHITREIRGLLCTYCNHRIVGRHRDGASLRKVADYIDQGTGWFVPKKTRTKTRKRSSVTPKKS